MTEVADATALADAFASGVTHPRTAIEASLARIERLDPLVGACNHVATRASLLAAAEEAANRWRGGVPLSSFDGVPFGVKANIAVRGLPWHAGVAALRHRVADEDAACVRRLRAAGLIPVAVLNMHEAALGETSNNPAFATTRNPWALERIAGGSSGGSAAAIASGMLPLALGTDSLGSVRLPSALCGVVGFKPAHGEIPTAGVEPLCPSLDHVGIHARSVRDVRTLLAILAIGSSSGPTAGDPPPLARWRLGGAGAVEPEVADAFNAAMAAAGFQRHSADTPDWSRFDLSVLRRGGLLLCERDAAQHFAVLLGERAEGFSAEFRRLVAWGAAQRASRVRQTQQHLARAAGALRDLLRHRLLACPTTPHTAPALDAPIPTTLADFTAPAAIAGVPAISVPVPVRGLPAGLQITGLRSSQVLAAGARLFPETAAVADPEREGWPGQTPDDQGSQCA